MRLLHFYLLLYTEILEVNLLAFAYRLFHEDFTPIYGAMIIYQDEQNDIWECIGNDSILTLQLSRDYAL